MALMTPKNTPADTIRREFLVHRDGADYGGAGVESTGV
jgi:hypothetical protein